MFLSQKKDGTTFLVPFYKRGNGEYAHKYGKQFRLYKQNFLQGITDNSVLFITLVTPYKSSFYGCRDSWIAIHDAIGPFIKAIRKKGAKYMAVLEATSEGLCHCHLLIRWDRPLQSSVRNNKHYLAEKELLKSITEKWNKEWMKVSKLKPNNNSVSVRVCPNQIEAGKAFDYATKHLGEGSSIEKSLDNVRENKETHLDLEKLFSNYWADKQYIKLYRPSRNLGME
jgi:hypothetical protein